MTSLEAKQILLAYRRGGFDEHDPKVAEALRRTAVEAELKTWFEGQQQFQDWARQELRSIQPPVDLKRSILAKVGQGAVIPAAPAFRRSTLLALAAAWVLLIGGGVWFFRLPSEESFTAFRSRMVNFALRTYQMDIVTNNPAAIRQFIAARGGAADFKAPANLEKLPVKGGGRLSWQSRPVSMVCYQLPTNETLYVFVIDQSNVKGELPPPAGAARLHKALNTVAFTRGGYTYLLAAKAPPETLFTLAADSPPLP